jgi:SAM-dependent methyltransferase
MKTVQLDGIRYESFTLGQWFLKVLADPWKNRLLPTSWLQRLTRMSRSPLIAETRRSPGSWRSMEIVYENQPPVDHLDRMAIRDNPISMAARNRRRYVVAELSRLMRLRSQGDQGDIINVLGIGAGPGLQVQDAFHMSGLQTRQLNAVFIDLDEDAFAHGRERAKEAGLLRSVHYIKGDAHDARLLIPDCQFHIVKLIGIIEYLTDAAVVELCSAIREVVSSESTILTHGIQDPYNAMPFLERVFHLKHRQRSGEEVAALLNTAGFTDHTVTRLPLNVYPMVLARPELACCRLKSLRDVA